MKSCMRGSAHREDGVSTVVVVLALTALLATGSLAVDVGNIWVVRTRLQHAADAAALAGAAVLPDEAAVVSGAVKYAELNDHGHPGILDPDDIEIGNWDLDARTFTLGANPRNSVRVKIVRSGARVPPTSSA